MRRAPHASWRALAGCALLLALPACRPPRPPELYRRASRLEAAAQREEALALYREGARGCSQDTPPCRLYRLRIGELLTTMGRTREALAAYVELRGFSRDPATVARASDRAAELLEGLRRVPAALRLSEETVRRFPGEVAAEDSLRRLLRLHAKRDGAAVRLLLELYRDLDSSPIAPSLLFEASAIYGRAGRQADARALLDQLAARYRRSALWDDALWQGAAICEAMRDWGGALARYRRLVASQRDAYILGSYNSVHLDDAQLRVARILLERLGDARGAVRELERLRDEFPHSLLRDDAQWWIAEIHLKAGDRAAACLALARLIRDFPDGNQTHKAREALPSLGCAAAGPR